MDGAKPQISIAQRLEQFQQRGFRRETAIVLVLIEEALHSLFATFPETFVLFGGTTLVLFYGSQRHSGDIDLLLDCEEPPATEQIINAIQPALAEVAAILGVGQLTITSLGNRGNLSKLQVIAADQGTLFTIDISRVSAVIKSELVEKPLLTSDAIVRYPSRNLLLLHKAEAFLGRKSVKCRDAFDIKVLMNSGAELGGNLKFHLEDGSVSERLEDAEFIRQRIAALTAHRCEAELRQYLPEDVFQELALQEFQPLRDSLEDLFSEWLVS